MNVHLIFRANHAGYAGKQHHMFEKSSLLDVFRQLWTFAAQFDVDRENSVYQRGMIVYGPGYTCLHELVIAITELNWPTPQSMQEVSVRLQEIHQRGAFREFHCTEQWVEILDTNDITEFAIYVFDSTYANTNPDRVAFLLYDDWKLPAIPETASGLTQAANLHLISDGAPDSCLYFVFLHIDGHYGLSHLGRGNAQVCQILGMQVPQFSVWLHAHAQANQRAECSILNPVLEGFTRFIQSLSPEQMNCYLEALTQSVAGNTWLYFNALMAADDRRLFSGSDIIEILTQTEFHDPAGTLLGSRSNVQPHLVQLLTEYRDDRNRTDSFHVLLFDDLWVAAHPDLAKSLLNYGRRWDILG